MFFGCMQLLLVFFVSLASSDLTCPIDWTPVRHKCFQNLEISRNFCEAAHVCAEVKGRLPQGQDWLEILTASDTKTRKALGSPITTWMGATPRSRTPWSWISGGEVQSGARGPTKTAQCAAMVFESRDKNVLKAEPCESERFFICELDPLPKQFGTFRITMESGTNGSAPCRDQLKVQNWLDCFVACKHSTKGRCTSLFFNKKEELCRVYHNQEEPEAMNSDWIGYDASI